MQMTPRCIRFKPLEILQAERYTYMRVVENKGYLWIAALKWTRRKEGNILQGRLDEDQL